MRNEGYCINSKNKSHGCFYKKKVESATEFHDKIKEIPHYKFTLAIKSWLQLKKIPVKDYDKYGFCSFKFPSTSWKCNKCMFVNVIDRSSLNSAFCKGPYCSRKNENLFVDLKKKINQTIRRSQKFMKINKIYA